MLSNTTPFGPSAIWITHDLSGYTPQEPAGTDHFPFSTDSGYMDIQGYKSGTQMVGGGLGSCDDQGHGFSAADAYWEAKIQQPSGGPGQFVNGAQWSGFWLFPPLNISNGQLSGEVDISEMGNDSGYKPGYHSWPGGNPTAELQVSGTNLSSTWHTYSVLIQAGGVVTWYLDGNQVWKNTLGTQFDLPMQAMLWFFYWPNATDGGIPGDFKVQYVRCWTAQ